MSLTSVSFLSHLMTSIHCLLCATTVLCATGTMGIKAHVISAPLELTFYLERHIAKYSLKESCICTRDSCYA